MDEFDVAHDEIERIVVQARVLRSRGENVAADRLLLEVCDKYPDHPSSLETRAFLLADQGKLREARDLLSKLIADHPGRLSAERKHAELVLRVAEQDDVVMQTLRASELNAIMNPAGLRRSAGTAAMLGLLFPGFGQIYNGELWKGVGYALLGAALWTCFGLFGFVSYSDGAGGMKSEFAPSAVWWGLLLLLLYIVGILDAAVSAPRSQVGGVPARPRPPVDKPFE